MGDVSGKKGGALSDAAMEAGMGRLLQVGVLLASLVVLVGGVLYLRTDGDGRVSYARFASEPEALRRWTELLQAVRHGEPAAVIQVGILLLIATPVARVVFAVVAFWVQRDWRYVGISVAVLAILLLSFLGSVQFDSRPPAQTDGPTAQPAFHCPDVLHKPSLHCRSDASVLDPNEVVVHEM